MKKQYYAASTLQKFASQCFVWAGVPQCDADWASEALVQADLQGRSSHGISRLHAYIRGIQKGKISPQPNISLTETGPCTGIMDGNDGLGPVVARAAMNSAISMAQKNGLGAVSIKRGNHAGALSLYSTLAAEEGLIGLAFSNAQPAIPPWGGRRAYFGTNPIALAVKGSGDTRISIDLATSIAARGNIIMAAKAGTSIPEGWAIDSDGVPTTNAEAALTGAVLPMAGPKGYSLALLVEILAGVLSGASVGDQVGSIYDDEPGAPDTGMFFFVIDPEFFIGRSEFSSRLDALGRDIHQAPLAKGSERIYLPGERSREAAQQRQMTGIELPLSTIQELSNLAQLCRIQPPVSIKGESEKYV